MSVHTMHVMELGQDTSELDAALERCEAHVERGGDPDDLPSIFGTPSIKLLVDGVVEGTMPLSAQWVGDNLMVDMGEGVMESIAQRGDQVGDAEVAGQDGIPPEHRGGVPPDWTESGLWLSEWQPPFDVVSGEQYRQEALHEIVGDYLSSGQGTVVPVMVDLVREPTNAHDPNAIRVEVARALVGYIGSDLAAVLAAKLDAASCARSEVPGVVCGGSSADRELSVYLWLDRGKSTGPDLIPPPDHAWTVTSWPPDEALTDEQAADLHVRREPDMDRFYELDLAIEAAWLDRDLTDVVAYSRESIELLPRFVARRSAEIVDDQPVTHHLNVVEYGGQVLAAIGDRDDLVALRAAVEHEPALAAFVSAADRVLALEGTITRVLKHVREHPGAIQSELAATFGMEKDLVSQACYRAAMAERLERSKRGRSYSLGVV
jgi:hypothetical protein